ncbi:MAG: DUF4422 domain-containing protein [Lachnospiraceae bacterium]|nr:DUF4422 domain-containing protein [Lachnospiraceae bacterium]
MNTLKLYVVSSHVDKPLEEKIINSKYEVPIQAGAALTDKRICERNDYDGFAESLSDKNRRLAEGTAIYWIYKHLDTDYVGIEHYRRRFVISDEELERYMESGVDLITTKPMTTEEPMQSSYIRDHFGGDWLMMMEILKDHDPEHYALYESETNSTSFHYGNINIMKKEEFIKYGDWIFPILEECLKRTPEKWDAYNARDVAFLMERLSHFYVMRMKQEGKKVMECEVKNYSKHAWVPADECDLKDMDAVYDACVRLYKARQVTKCSILLWAARQHGADKDERLGRFVETLSGWIFERNRGQISMCEYLPDEMKNDLESLCTAFNQLKQMVNLYAQNPTEETKALFMEYLKMTGYSMLLVDYLLEQV